jgi:hypothetical protein
LPNVATFAGPASFSGTLTNSGEATFTFNGATTVTKALTTSAALTIAGTGAVTLVAAPVLTNGLTVTNMTGVSMPSVGGDGKIPTEKSIDASEGKVIFGTTTNSTTLTNATIASAETAQAKIAADGVITLEFNSNAASLTLADGGSIAITGSSAKVELPHTVFGAGTYTATGEVTITAGDATPGDTLVTAAGAGNGLILGSAPTALSLLTHGTAATYTFTAADSKKIVLGNGATAITVGKAGTTDSNASKVSASATASIVLGTGGNATDAIKLGNGAILELENGAKIGVFTAIAAASSNGTKTSIGTTTKGGGNLASTLGTIAVDGSAVTLTGATAGTSVINAGLEF